MRARSFSLCMVCCVFIFITVVVRAQTYPSALVTTFVGPKTLFLDEYADPFQPKIRTTIFFTDFSESTWNFGLRLKINGPNGIIIQSKPGILPVNPLVVSPGQPYILEGADLAFYFNLNNLLFTGITRAQIEVNGRLPEGLYTFCFEAVDYESTRALSLPACATAYLSLNDPALIVSPVCGSVVENTSFQNILFQWQINNATGNLNLSQLTYKIDLYEVNNSASNPLTAIINNQALPIWQSQALTLNTYVYTSIDPPLVKGKRYVFTVTTSQNNGRQSFKNNGVSVPCYFHYGYFEGDTIDIVTPVDQFQFALSTPSFFKWKKPRKALPAQMYTYTLKLVEVNASQDAETAIISNSAFYQQTYLPVNDAFTDKTIPVTFWMNIKRMGHYAWQVYASSGTQQVAESKVYEFTGPPAIENFIAGGFLMTIVKLSSYDTINHIISGRCKTTLNNFWNQQTEFNYNNIGITSIGNNEWVMNTGSINDKILTPSYTLMPESFADNKSAYFKPDSVFVNTSGLKLSGKTEWNIPHAGTSQQIEKITSRRCLLTLANTSFYLNNSDAITLSKDYKIALLEPYGFTIKINQASNLNIYQSKYEFNFGGFIQLPLKVQTSSNTAANIFFNNSHQLHYITPTVNVSSESIRLAHNSSFDFQPNKYIFDFYEKLSPAEFSTDSTWKGLYIEQAKLDLPKAADKSGQITLPFARAFNFTNTTADTNSAYVTSEGLFLKATVPFVRADSIKFNGFVSKLGYFYTRIAESEIEHSFLSGGIFIPVIDTANSFPYFIEMTDKGFNEGYLINGLANTTFTFNSAGSNEQKIPITIKRAVFKGRNRLEMDLDMLWPYFSLSLTGVQRFSAWGNGNIGFDVPNGKAALTYQATGKSSNYDITVDYLGCGRNGNAYAFGASAKINMDEEISGETGPPVINAYSFYKNPLLTGMVYVPPVSTVIVTTTIAATSSTYQSSSSGYTNALSVGYNDALSQLGFSPSDTASSPLQSENSAVNNNPLINGNTVMQIKELIDIVYRLKPYIGDKISVRDWMVLDRFRSALQTDIIQQSQVTNGKQLLNFVLNKMLDHVVTQINGTVQEVSDKAMYKVRLAISNKVVSPINNRIDKSISSVFAKLEQKILMQVDEQYHAAVKASFVSIKGNLISGIRNSVNNSFETNVTGRINNFVQLGVTAKIKSFIRIEITSAGQKLISEGADANINIQNVIDNAGVLFTNIADTVKEAIVNLNAANFVNTAENLVDDAIAGIDWNQIAAQITQDLLAKGLSSAIANNVAQIFGANAGPYVSAVLNTVKFDFSNLGEKLQNGQFDKIVKFDVTNIYLVTPAVNVRGSLKFTKDDSIYGDSWQANVFVCVKVPKKDNPIECTGFFLNGKTTQNPQNFTYWFVKLGVTGFNIPLTPAPVIWDGVEGFAYSKMKKTGINSVIPDKTNKFGVGCKFYFYDQQSSGGSYIFDLGAEAEFNDGGFSIQLVGNASMLNTNKTNGKYHAPGFVTGTGTLGYYKTPQFSKIAGNFNIQLNTQPILCAGGDVGLDLKSPNDWKFWVGTPTNPIGVKVLCKDFLSNTAFLQVSNTGFSAGLAMNVNLNAQSPWIELSAIKVRGFAQFELGYSASASLEWEPTFKINEASVSAWVVAAIGVEYETAATASSLTIAGVSLSGTLGYKSVPESELHGELAGSITVVGYSCAFNTPVHYSLSQQQIIN